jgi:hypothetical protein
MCSLPLSLGFVRFEITWPVDNVIEVPGSVNLPPSLVASDGRVLFELVIAV